MKKFLLLLLPAAYCLLPTVAMAQCGSGGCCPNGQCMDYGVWRSSSPKRTQVLPSLPPTPIEPAEVNNQPTLADRECFRSVVRVKTVDRDGGHSYGSGTAVLWGNRLAILTASHVVRDAREICVRGKTGYHRAAIMRRGHDKTWDVAVLVTHTADDFLPAVKLAYRATGHPKPGDPLTSCGFGGDGQLKINHGRFRRYACSVHDSSRTDWMILSGTARAGDSGGPVFNSRGELVGVLWGTDGHDVVATQCGRLHVIMQAALGKPREVQRKKDEVRKTENNSNLRPSNFILHTSYPTAVPDRQVKTKMVPVRPTGIFNRERDCGPMTCRPKTPQQPRVIVQSDPSVSRKLDVLIQNTTPLPPKPEEKDEPRSTSPLIMFLVIGSAVVLGFVVYFGTQRGD